MKLKRLHTLLLSVLLLLPVLSAQAVIIQSGAQVPVPVFVTDVNGNPVTGIASNAFTLTVRKPSVAGYTAGFVAAGGTIGEGGNGEYDYTPTSAETTSDGSKKCILLVHAVVTATTTSFGDSSAQIVAYDPLNAANLGLTNLDAAISSRSTYAGADTAGTTTLLGRIPGTVQPQSGDAFLRLGAAGAGLTALGDGRLANLDVAVSSRSTYAGTDTAGITTLLGRLTAQRATNLDNLDASISGIPTSILGASAASWNTANSIGAKINAAANAGAGNDPFTNLTSTTYANGTFGALLKINLANPVPSDYAQRGTAPTWYLAPTNPTDYARNNAAPSWYASGGDPWSTLLTAETTSGTFGAFLKAQLANAVPSDYQQRGVAVTLPAQAPTGYGAGTGTYYAPIVDNGSTTTTSLVVSLTRNSQSQPVLAWTADPQATYYKVLRSTNGLTYSVIATGFSGTSYTDTTRPSGTVYYDVIGVH